ncbi:MAG: hypothetical protein RLZZ210_1256 [Pseudomonadota bacterium]|jgi:hypothetical protein
MITIKNTYKTDKINTHTNKLLEDITSDEAHKYNCIDCISSKNLASTQTITQEDKAKTVEYTKSTDNKQKKPAVTNTIETWHDFNMHMLNVEKKAIEARDGSPIAMTKKAKDAINNIHIEYINQMYLMFSKIEPDNLSQQDIKKYREICRQMVSLKGQIGSSIELLQHKIYLGSSILTFSSYSKSEFEFDKLRLYHLNKLVEFIETKYPILTTKEMLEFKPHYLLVSKEQLSNTGLIQPPALTIEEVMQKLT